MKHFLLLGLFVALLLAACAGPLPGLPAATGQGEAEVTVFYSPT